MNRLINIEKLIADVIPPADRQHREGFTNKDIIDRLDGQELELLEVALINKLVNTHDTLIVDTLAYMKSAKSVPVLLHLLQLSPNPMFTIIVCSGIFEINHDKGMIPISIDAFNQLNSVYQKTLAFYYLRKFRSEITDAIIKRYLNDANYLLSYNAKRVLGLEFG